VRILIANRGEVARRIQRSATRLGHETVAVYADPDRDAPFVAEASASVRIGPAALAESYLDPARLLDAAARSGASAVHPGYGFLSESAAFARAVADAGLVWIGPHAKAIEQMGSKIEARRLAASAGVATIPGFDGSQDPADLADAAAGIGYPVLVKAAAGGGGKGIRVVHDADHFPVAVIEAAQEAKRAFGDSAVIIERYIERARHVEVQVVGDRHGNVVDLGTRECSVQRRFQKLLEEAPAPNLADATRSGLCEAARELARSIGYDSLGTVEFVVDAATQEFFFLEMNTRLQVEHPVTEEITGLDLVALQLGCAEGDPLPLTQSDVAFQGHAFEVRINAEDPAAGFAPVTGTVEHLRVPPNVRWESGVERGSLVTPHYDSLLAKLIVHGPDRESARRRLAQGLDRLILGGIATNAGFHRWLIDRDAVALGQITTRFLEECEIPGDEGEETAVRLAARAWIEARNGSRTSGPWSALGSFRVTPCPVTRSVALADRGGEVRVIEIPSDGSSLQADLRADLDGVTHRFATSADLERRSVAVNVAGHTRTYRALSRSERWAPVAAQGHGAADVTRAPFPAIVTDTPVRPGDRVAAGDVVVVIEAMKMLHSLSARGAGRIAEVRVSEGESVESGQVLVTYEPAVTSDSESENE
jgi:3-methylcrotonyl-CoA carboxylase alpha subunit